MYLHGYYVEKNIKEALNNFKSQIKIFLYF